MKIKELFGDSFYDGLSLGLKIADEIAKKQGYELIFPNIDSLEIFPDNDETKKLKGGKENVKGKFKTT